MSTFKNTQNVVNNTVKYLGDSITPLCASKLAIVNKATADDVPAWVLECQSTASDIRKQKSAHADWENLARPSTSNSKIRETGAMLGIPKTCSVAFDLLAGVTCPFAGVCRARVKVDKSGKRTKIVKKADAGYCYAADLEAAFTNSYLLHASNTKIVMSTVVNDDQVFNLAKNIVTGLLVMSPNIVKTGGVVRIHASGDFINDRYMQAWIMVAQALPHVVFFGYSKGVKVVQALNDIPNMFFIFSHGSKQDDLADSLGLSKCYVRCDDSEYQGMTTACEKPTDPTDFYTVLNGLDFALDLH